MKKDIKDYLHLYLPFEAMTQFDTKVTVGSGNLDGFYELKWKPILRPLSDMKSSERWDYQNMLNTREELSDIIKSANSTHYLLKQGFDLFGLIDAGLAIDKTTLKP